MKNWKEYAENILIAVILALIVRSFLVTGYKVPTASMAPTLLPGDFIFAFKIPYGVKIPFSEKKIASKMPGRGDVTVFTYVDQPRVTYVKRVMGLPGDRIEIKNGRLVVNSEAAEYFDQNDIAPVFDPELFKIVTEKIQGTEHQLVLQKEPQSKSFGPFIVPPGEVFLLGDNRDSSDDSRYWGTVPIDRIEGRVFWIWLSLDWQRRIWENRLPTLRSERIGRSVN